MIQWWYADNGTQAGPMDFDALGQIDAGRQDQPRHTGMA